MSRLRRALTAALLTVGIALSIAGAATPATAGSFRVVGVNSPDVLNIRSGPSASHDIVGTIPPRSAGIEGLGECRRGWCLIRFGSVEGWVNARFLAPDDEEAVAAPEPEADPDPSAPPPAGEPTRRVLADGTLELRRSDGSALRLTPEGRDVLVSADGTVRSLTYLQVQSSNLPPLPPELAGWGSRIGDDLLGILRNILTPGEMNAYLQTENGKSYYELVQWRLRSIAFLTRPAS